MTEFKLISQLKRNRVFEELIFHEMQERKIFDYLVFKKISNKKSILEFSYLHLLHSSYVQL